MIYLTIKTSDPYISVFDIENPGRCYNFRKPKAVTERIIFRLFMDLAVKSWMNPETLLALKEEIIELYPEATIRWNAIQSSFLKSFVYKEKGSFHIQPRKKEYNPYRP